jgi:hypothetical protein
MSSAKIEIALLPIVRRYGFEQVHQSLHEVEIAERQCAKYKQDKPSPYGEMITKSTKRGQTDGLGICIEDANSVGKRICFS